MKFAVVGHVEWASFVKVDHLPSPGEILHSSMNWEEAAGGGGVAAVQLARIAGDCTLFTAFGNDDYGKSALDQLKKLGVEVYASISSHEPTQRSFIQINKDKERSITVCGDLEPSGHDKSLPWEKLSGYDAVYFVSGDSEALIAASQAKHLVSTSRTLNVLEEAPVKLDALVMSQKDKDESYEAGNLDPKPSVVIRTKGKEGFSLDDGRHFEAEYVAFDELKDTYGCGDSFAAGLTYGIGQDLSLDETLKLAAHYGSVAAKRDGAHGLKPS